MVTSWKSGSFSTGASWSAAVSNHQHDCASPDFPTPSYFSAQNAHRYRSRSSGWSPDFSSGKCLNGMLSVAWSWRMSGHLSLSLCWITWSWRKQDSFRGNHRRWCFPALSNQSYFQSRVCWTIKSRLNWLSSYLSPRYATTNASSTAPSQSAHYCPSPRTPESSTPHWSWSCGWRSWWHPGTPS